MTNALFVSAREDDRSLRDIQLKRNAA